jgi:hypothetical protein
VSVELALNNDVPFALGPFRWQLETSLDDRAG